MASDIYFLYIDNDLVFWGTNKLHIEKGIKTTGTNM